MSIFHTALGKVKEHPYLTAAGVGTLLLVLLVSSRGSTQAATATTDTSTAANATTAAEVQAANALQTTQLQYQAASQQVNAQAQVALGAQSASLAGLKDQDATQLALGTLAAGSTDKQTASSLSAILAQLGVQQDSIDQQAAIQGLQINASNQTAQQQIATNGQVQLAAINTQAATQQLQITTAGQTADFAAAQSSYQVSAAVSGGVQNAYNADAVAIAALGGGNHLSSPAQGGF